MSATKTNLNDELLAEKINDATTPGVQIEFEPEDATAVGAFKEHALTESEAQESQLDSIIRE